jgi:hypothetical protein
VYKLWRGGSKAHRIATTNPDDGYSVIALFKGDVVTQVNVVLVLLRKHVVLHASQEQLAAYQSERRFIVAASSYNHMSLDHNFVALSSAISSST